MKPDDGLVDQLFREQVRRARAMSPEERFLAGPRLFERSCRIMADGIRHQHPQASEEEVQQILTAQLALLRRLERGS